MECDPNDYRVWEGILKVYLASNKDNIIGKTTGSVYEEDSQIANDFANLIAGCMTRLALTATAAGKVKEVEDSVGVVIKDGKWECLIVDDTLIAFNTDIETTIPERVKSINWAAYSWRSDLDEVILPKNLKKIGDKAFCYCAKLQNVRFPDSLEEIGFGAFWGCDNLREIVLPPNLKKIDENAFRECKWIGNMKFSDSIEVIGRYAFSECTRLVKIALPNNLREIGKGAFDNCAWLSEVEFPASLEVIREYAFTSCPFLKKVEVSKSTEIYKGAFDKKTKVKKVRFKVGK